MRHMSVPEQAKASTPLAVWFRDWDLAARLSRSVVAGLELFLDDGLQAPSPSTTQARARLARRRRAVGFSRRNTDKAPARFLRSRRGGVEHGLWARFREQLVERACIRVRHAGRAL